MTPIDNAVLAASRVRSAGSLLARSDTHGAIPVHAADSASCALTHFELTFPITVDISVSVDDALKDMSRLGLEALLVVAGGGLSDEGRKS